VHQQSKAEFHSVSASKLARRSLLALLLSLGTAVGAFADDAAFDSFFRLLLDEAGVPGGAYAIVRNGRVVAVQGHGVRDLSTQAPVTADTVFRIASVSKTVAAQMTSLLVNDGALRWDDTLGRFLPAFEFKQAGQAGQLQIQDLIGQSTGIVPNAYDNLLDANVTMDKILPHFRAVEPVCERGRCYTYQNILFGLIEPVLEQVSGQTYAQLVEDRLFEPLDMRSASTGMERFLASPNRAAAHVKRQGRWVEAAVQPGYYGVAPAAGVNASANDLARWLLAQLGYRADILPPAVIEPLTVKRVRTQRELRRRGWQDWISDAHYGLGWRIYQLGEEEIYLHSGWVKGFVADISYSRRHDTGLVLLLNAEAGLLGEISAGFWSQVLPGANGTRLYRAVLPGAGHESVGGAQ